MSVLRVPVMPLDELVDGAADVVKGLMSFAETATNVLVGYWVAVVTQLLVFPVVGIAESFEASAT